MPSWKSGLRSLRSAKKKSLSSGVKFCPVCTMMWSKFSSSSLFRVDHSLIISGRVPKMDITFIRASLFYVPGFRGQPRSRPLQGHAGQRVQDQAHVRQRHDHAPAALQVVAAALGDLGEVAPGEYQQVIGRVLLQRGVGAYLEVRARRVVTPLGR